MHRLGWLALALAALPACAQVPRVVAARPCAQAPRIDGELGPGEWDEAFHLAWPLQLTRLPEATLSARQADLWVMNSPTQLYLAFRVPDPVRQADLDPPAMDVVLLGFAADDAIAPGDDRKVLLPGVYADKHMTGAGQDADDGHADGRGVLRWHAGDGGFYVAELAVPLDAGDPDDIALAPGEAIKFNLVYADGFRLDGQTLHVGGLFGNSGDDATDWGVLELAETTTTETPATAPDWLTALVPHTGPPDRLAHRLSRTDAAEMDLDGHAAGVVRCEFIYPRLDGETETAQARLYLPPALRETPGRRVPLVYNAGYELDDGSALGLVREGYAVATPQAHPLNPLARGPNLDRCLLHALRQLPFVDGRRILVQGGSAGGWATLMVAAEAFPLSGAMPAVPPIDWAYNGAFIGTQGTTGPPPAELEGRQMPVLGVVFEIADGSRSVTGQPFDAPIYRALSPIAHLERITAPVQVFFSSADMLVPVDQVGAEWVRPLDPTRFPAGFTTSPAACLPGEHRPTLFEALPAAAHERFIAALPPERVGMKPDATPEEGTPPRVELPFSTVKPWSVILIDEGPVEPHVGHFKFAWNLDGGPFRAWAMKRGAQAEQLTAAKLSGLMQRLAGEVPLSGAIAPDGAAPRPANLLDWPEAERADVLRGLRDFATDDACAVALGRAYAALPADLRRLGAPPEPTALAVRVWLAASQ